MRLERKGGCGKQAYSKWRIGCAFKCCLSAAKGARFPKETRSLCYSTRCTSALKSQVQFRDFSLGFFFLRTATRPYDFWTSLRCMFILSAFALASVVPWGKVSVKKLLQLFVERKRGKDFSATSSPYIIYIT